MNGLSDVCDDVGMWECGNVGGEGAFPSYISMSHIEHLDATSNSSMPHRKQFDATSNNSTPRRTVRRHVEKFDATHRTARHHVAVQRFHGRFLPTRKVSAPWFKTGFSGSRREVESQRSLGRRGRGGTTPSIHAQPRGGRLPGGAPVCAAEELSGANNARLPPSTSSTQTQ